MELKILIKNIVIIVVLLTVVLLSQQSQFKNTGKDLFSNGIEQGNTYWMKTNDWVRTNIWPKISGEVVKKEEIIKEEITKQKNNIAQNIWEKIKNYFAEKFSKTFGTQVK